MEKEYDRKYEELTELVDFEAFDNIFYEFLTTSETGKLLLKNHIEDCITTPYPKYENYEHQLIKFSKVYEPDDEVRAEKYLVVTQVEQLYPITYFSIDIHSQWFIECSINLLKLLRSRNMEEFSDIESDNQTILKDIPLINKVISFNLEKYDVHFEMNFTTFECVFIFKSTYPDREKLIDIRFIPSKVTSL